MNHHQHEPHIILIWLLRLRWLAIAGQLAATAVAAWGLWLKPPLAPIAAVLVITVLTNLLLTFFKTSPSLTARLILIILLLDMGLLTVLLYYTGGPENPFSSLYLVHVAMAVAVARPIWTWSLVVAAAICYGFLFQHHWPLTRGQAVPLWADQLATWIALVLVAVLIAYFIGRVTASLRQREQELAVVRQRIARNEQLASLATLAAGAAHELGTPLGTIAVVAKEIELAAKTHPEDQSLCEDARLIRAQADRCRDILDRMRGELIQESRQEIVPVNLSDFVDQLRQDLRPGESNRLHCETGDATSFPGRIPLPLHDLRQAVGLLLRNAFDASSPHQTVQLSLCRQNQMLRVEVSDTGQGMSPETLARTGEPFFTTKQPGQGMGLGLYLVRLVAERYGGSLHLQSELTKGTRSTLLIPT